MKQGSPSKGSQTPLYDYPIQHTGNQFGHLRLRTPLATCNDSRYNKDVITSFRHKGLERYFRRGVTSGIQADHAARLRLILGRLNASTGPQDMNLPGLHLHQLQGARHGTWSVRVSGNWRVTFQFDGEDATQVGYEDYH